MLLELCLITWNIHGGANPTRLFQEFEAKHSTCQVWALQETGDEDSDFSDQLAEHTGRNIFRNNSNAIVTTLPILDSGTVSLPPQGERTAVWVDLQTESRNPVRVYTFHLTYKVNGNPFVSKFRKNEMREILAHAQDSPYPVILAGDFNSLGWFLGGHSSEGCIKETKKAGFTDAHRGRGTRTHDLVGQIDWIFYRNLNIYSSTYGSKAGSDHRWVQTVFGI